MKFVAFAIATLALIAGCLCDDLPSFIHVCHKDDPNINECFIASVEDLRPYLVKGVPEYNIPSIEPLIMHDLICEEVAGMKITTSNVSAYGCSEYFVRKVTIDWEEQTIVLDVDIPKLRILAHYVVDGKLLLLPVKGNGNMEANVTDCISKTTMHFELIEKDGDRYLRFTSCDLKVKVTGGAVRLENLFNGDKVALSVINDVVNKNLDAFLRELMPVIEKQLAITFLDVGNKVVEPFAYKQLFPH